MTDMVNGVNIADQTYDSDIRINFTSDINGTNTGFKLKCNPIKTCSL